MASPTGVGGAKIGAKIGAKMVPVKANTTSSSWGVYDTRRVQELFQNSFEPCLLNSPFSIK